MRSEGRESSETTGPSLQDFVEAETSRRYVVKILVDAYGGQVGRIVNDYTSEVLIISHGTDMEWNAYLEVERKALL